MRNYFSTENLQQNNLVYSNNFEDNKEIPKSKKSVKFRENKLKTIAFQDEKQFTEFLEDPSINLEPMFISIIKNDQTNMIKSQSLWKLERNTVQVGGLIQCNNSYKIKQFLSGKYLSVKVNFFMNFIFKLKIGKSIGFHK